VRDAEFLILTSQVERRIREECSVACRHNAIYQIGKACRKGIASHQFETRVSYRKLKYYHHIYASNLGAEGTDTIE
jgi:hypothetical protein